MNVLGRRASMAPSCGRLLLLAICLVAPVVGARWSGRRVLLLLAVCLVAPVGGARLELQLDEGRPAGTVVGDVTAGLPLGAAASLFFISDHEGTGVTSDLHIDEHTGVITTAKVLDRELRDRYSFIAVTMTGVTVEVVVTVNDINDHAPSFPQKRVRFSVPEQTAVGTRFPLDPAPDADGGELTTQGYAIRDGNAMDAFRLETRRGNNRLLYLDLVVNAPLDREARSSYSLAIEAFDGGSPQRRDHMTLDVIVQDVNDNAPEFNQSRYHATIPENLPPGSSVLQVFAADPDEGPNGVVLYEINRRQSDPERCFVVDAHSGVISLNRALDFETRRVHELVVQARDNATHPEVSDAFVTIHVRDYNDNQPAMTVIFLSEDGAAHVSEAAAPGQYVARVSVSDPDYGEFAHVNVSLEGGDGRFTLTTKDGVIYLICVERPLDREERDAYDLRVTATDQGTPPLRADARFTLQVLDVNDNPPLFDAPSYRHAVPEGAAPGSFVLQVTARDRDHGANGEVRYSLASGADSSWFTVNADTGIISTLAALDYELSPAPRLVVVATDGGTPPLSSTAVVHIELQDANDNAPVFERSFYNATVSEDAAPGTCVTEVTASDADGGSYGALSYSLTSGTAGSAPFSVHKQSGQICTDAELDRDLGPSAYDLRLTATDGGGLSSVTNVRIDVVDVNDNPPTFYPLTYSASLSTRSAPGTSVARVTAFDPDAGENGSVTYRTVPGGDSPFFTLNTDTGVISLAQSLAGEADAVVSLVISAQDGRGLAALVPARVDVSVTSGSVAPPVFQQPQYHFSVSEGALRGTELGRVQATAGGSGGVSFAISGGDPGGFFVVDARSGALRTNRSLDHEAQPEQELEVEARGGNPPAFAHARVHVSISDINDHAPTFLPSTSASVLLPPHAALGTLVYRVVAEDRDSGANGLVSFALAAAASSAAAFSLDRDSGEIRLAHSLDYDRVPPRYDLQVVARDGGEPQQSATFTLVVHVRAESDHGPVFDTQTYGVELREGTPINTRFLQVRALDRDTSHATLHQDTSHATLDRDTSHATLDRDISHAALHQDTSGSQAVEIRDRPERPDVLPNNDRESSLAAVRYHLRSDGDAVRYHLRPDGDAASFGVEADSGWLFVRSALDREARESYLVTVLATSGLGARRRTSSAAVRITVVDENDNAPRLAEGRGFMAVRENLPPGTGFGHVTATDRDSGANGRLSYRLLQGETHFQINPNTGELSTRLTLDRELQSSFQLIVLVQDGGSPSLTATGTIFISVQDENDHAPSFTHSKTGQSLVIQVLEGQTSGTLLSTIHAIDPDEGENGTVYYSLSGPRAEMFSLHGSTGELRSSSLLLHSDRPEYRLTVSASDRGAPSRSSSCLLLVQIISASRPSLRSNSVSLILEPLEDTAPGSVVGSVRLDDREPRDDITYSLADGSDRGGTFVVDRLTGDVLLARPLDFEVKPRFTLEIDVHDFSQTPATSTAVSLAVNVRDTNDHAPTFPHDPVTVVVSENARTGASIHTFQAVDGDGAGPNSELRYSVEQQWPDSPGLLRLDPVSGVLSLGQQLDREDISSLVLVVRATDQALDVSQRRWGSVTVRVYVTDENDNAPVFSSPLAVSVMEDQPVGFVVLYVMARDADHGENGRVSYGIERGNTGGAFSLNPSSGALTVSKALDREQQEVFNLTVTAEDHGKPRRRSSQELRVHVIDVNDETPRFEHDLYEAQVSENRPPGTSVLSTSATDLDLGTNAEVTYGVVPEDFFSINPSTGAISTTKRLDRELQEVHTLTVLARDGGLPPNFAKTTVKIRVTDENDHAPRFARLFYSIEVPENTEPQPLFTIRARDEDTGERGDISYRVVAGDPSGDFHLDAVSGVLSTSRPLDRERRAGYTLTVRASDRGSPSLSSSVSVEVSVLDLNDHSPRFQSPAYTADISEDAPIGSLVLHVQASDLDQGANGQIAYHLSQGSRSVFVIDQSTGRIVTAAALDRERVASYDFQVFAMDASPDGPRSSTAQVTVYIQDVNDNAPHFLHDPLVLNVSAASGRSVLATMKAEDKDFGANGSVFYRFARPTRGFAINSLTGDIQATERLQMLTQNQRTLLVQAVDQGSPAQSAVGVVIVYLREQEDRGVRFPRSARDVSLQENAPQGTVVTQVQAQYPDGSQTGISYSIFSGNRLGSFGINTITGEIWVQKSEGLDFEESPRVRLVVKAETASSSSYAAINLLLQDVNDNLPRFHLQNYVAYIQEAQGRHVSVIQVSASDRDQGLNAQLTYSLRSSSMSALFKIDPVSGSISTAAIMDREIWTQTQLVITATDRGSPRLAGSATLTVIVVDLNDNSPMIPAPRELHLPEDTLIGTIITQVTGNDVDSGPALSYSLHLPPDSRGGHFSILPPDSRGGHFSILPPDSRGGHFSILPPDSRGGHFSILPPDSRGGHFSIHRFGGGVSLTTALDHETTPRFTLAVRASDSEHHSEAYLTVVVEDVNDNCPQFNQDIYEVTVSEHLTAGSAVITVTATDRDSEENGRITYSIVSSTRGGFYIDPDNGTLVVTQRLEFEVLNPSVLVLIEARDHGSPRLSSVTTVQLRVSDANDNAPVFQQTEYRASLPEDRLPGATVLTLEATDADLSRENCGFDFAIASGNVGNTFQLESSVRFTEGRGFRTVASVVLVERLDFEAVPKYNLTVVVSDRGVPQRSSSAAVVINISDANDNPPAFTREDYRVVVSESAAVGTEILHLSAIDPDLAPNGEVCYSISSGDECELFQVDTWTGALRLRKFLSSESRSSHTVVIQASDGQGHYTFAPVTIEVKDVNDNRPFFPLKQVTASIRENQPQNAFVTTLHAIDRDRGVHGQLRYFMADEAAEGGNAFKINQTTGEIHTCSSFDFETVSSFHFTVAAVDAGNYSATVTVQVYITGLDEYDPIFTYPEFFFQVPDGARKGQVIGKVDARDEDSGVDGVVVYSLMDMSPYFDVNRSTGEILLKMDSYSRHVSLSKRELRQMALEVTAHSPLETSRRAVAKVVIDVTHTAFGLPTDMNTVLVSAIAVSLGTIVILILIAVALFFVKLRRESKYHKGHGRKPGSSTMMHRFEETKIAANEILYHQALPGYTTGSNSSAGPFTRGGSLDPSHSSGRGSAEAAEDDEIRMINEYPRVSSISSSMQERISARGPDSGIQQDADQLSDVSGDAGSWFKRKKNGSLSGSIVSGHTYRDDSSSYVSVGRGLTVCQPKDYTFPADGKPAVDGSLTAIVATDEELRGSYNWDYLLNWCPQFQPLASVFSEIARLKDETSPQQSRLHFHHKAKLAESRIDPPPLITAVAHPGAKTVPPKPATGRTFLGSFRRSPLSDQGSVSSAAMSPSFSPSLSPLGARSPAVTPFSASHGPATSIISTNIHRLEHEDDVELRI